MSHNSIEAVLWKVGHMIKLWDTNYKLISRLGSGGFGEVWLVESVEDELLFALKRPKNNRFKDQQFGRRLHWQKSPEYASFLHEVKILILLDFHPNIVTFLGFAEIDLIPVIILEYVPIDNPRGSMSLQTLLQEGDYENKWEVLLNIAIQVATGMSFVNGKVIHKDLKPANILITNYSNNIVAKITDFGIGKMLQIATSVHQYWNEISENTIADGENIYEHNEIISRTLARVGTFGYSSPEQVIDKSDISNKSDVFSFGVILYVMATHNGSLVQELRDVSIRYRNRHIDDVNLKLSFLNLCSKYLSKLEEHLSKTGFFSANYLVSLLRNCLQVEPTDRPSFDIVEEELRRIYKTEIKKEYLKIFKDETKYPSRQARSILLQIKGDALHNMGNPKEAVDSFNKAIELDPKNEGAWNDKGITLVYLGNPEEAVDSFNKAIELDPNSVDAWANKGHVLEGLQRYQEAISCLNMAIQLDPTESKAWIDKGNALIGLEKPEEAIICYDKALQIDPIRVDGLFGKGYALRLTKKYDEAIRWYDKALKMDPSNMDSLNGKALVLVECLNKPEEALKIIDSALTMGPHFTNTIYTKGLILDKLGRINEAIDCYNMIIDNLDPSFPDAWYDRARSKLKVNDIDGCLNDLNKAVQLYPTYKDRAVMDNDFNSLKEDERFIEIVGES